MSPSTSLGKVLLLTVGWIILVSLQNFWVAAAKCSFYSQVLELSSTIPVMCAASLALALNMPGLTLLFLCPCVLRALSPDLWL